MYEAAMTNVRVMIDEWTEMADELGRPIPNLADG